MLADYRKCTMLLYFLLTASLLLFLFSLVCAALRGKTKAFNEMEANFKVSSVTPRHIQTVICTVKQ